MPSQMLLFDQPRSSGNLLQRILSKQPKLELLDSPYSACRGKQVDWLLSEEWHKGMPEAIHAAFNESAQEATTRWREALDCAQKDGKILMVHDHPFSTTDPGYVINLIDSVTKDAAYLPRPGNFTTIPDDVLLHPNTIPILTIRDPRLTVTSAYRVLKAMGLPHGSGRPNFLISTSTLWQRLLYDFFISNGVEPLVVDGDDVMTDPEFTRQLCKRLGLDPDAAIFRWEPAGEAEKAAMHPVLFASQRWLIESAGIKPERAAKNINLEAEERGWKDEFGEDLELIRDMVALALPSYEYLHERRFKGEV